MYNRKKILNGSIVSTTSDSEQTTPFGVDTLRSHNNNSKSAIRNELNRRQRVRNRSTVFLISLTIIFAVYTFVMLRFSNISIRKHDELYSPTNVTMVNTELNARNPRIFLQQIQEKIKKKKTIISNRMSKNGQSLSNFTLSDDECYIVYDATLGGQGTGNLISGLLSAHLFGKEFNRIVCVNQLYYPSFLNAFESVDPMVIAKCPDVLYYVNNDTSNIIQQSIEIINFVGAADECKIQNIMLDRTKKVIRFMGNTYPRWPPIDDYYFLHYYQPTKVLFDMLPYTSQPEFAVHLREPDEITVDPRRGLDDASLTALGQLLPRNVTFLVTNNVAYYDRFAKCCNWKNSNWDGIKHSATEKIWGNSDQVDYSIETQNLRMWSDWYTILMAGTVYHTHSDFSVSAIHWMNNRNSFSIKGYNRTSKQLETTVESWWYDGETIPLNQRTLDGKPETTNELRACSDESRQLTAKREKQQAAAALGP